MRIDKSPRFSVGTYCRINKICENSSDTSQYASMLSLLDTVHIISQYHGGNLYSVGGYPYVFKADWLSKVETPSEVFHGTNIT